MPASHTLREYQKIIRHINPQLSPREIYQNIQDSGASWSETILGFCEDKFFAIYTDNGCGMDYDTLNRVYLNMYSSTKEHDLTKTGKYGIGSKPMLGLPWLYTMLTTQPKNGEKSDVPSIGVTRGSSPVYRLVFTDNQPEIKLPEIDLYTMEYGELKGTGESNVLRESFGTSIMQIMQPGNSMMQTILEVLDEWVRKIPTPMYVGVAQDWKLQAMEGKNAYKIAGGPTPAFVKLNETADIELGLDRLVLNGMVHDGIKLPGIDQLERAGLPVKRYYGLGMVKEFIGQVAPEYRTLAVNALSALRVERSIGPSRLIVGVDGSKQRLEVRNHGILLAVTDERFPAGICAYLDSPAVNHTLTRDGVAKDGKRGLEYQRMVAQVKDMSVEAYEKFFRALNAGVIGNVADEAFSIIASAARRVLDDELKEAIHSDQHRKRSSAVGDFRIKLEAILGESALDYCFASTPASTTRNISFNQLLHSIEKLDGVVMDEPGFDNIKLLQRYGLLVIAQADKEPVMQLGCIRAFGRANFITPVYAPSTSDSERGFLSCLAKKTKSHCAVLAGLGPQQPRAVLVEDDASHELYMRNYAGYVPLVMTGSGPKLVKSRMHSLIINTASQNNEPYLNLARVNQEEFAASLYAKLMRGSI